MDLLDPNATVQKLGPSASPFGRFGTPSTLRRTLALRYLQVRSSRVSGWTVRDGRTLYRVAGSGAPVTATSPSVRNYSVVAHVDRRGMIHDLAARFQVRTVHGTATVRIQITYGRVGRTFVTTPQWYSRVTGTDAVVGDAGRVPTGVAARAPARTTTRGGVHAPVRPQMQATVAAGAVDLDVDVGGLATPFAAPPGPVVPVRRPEATETVHPPPWPADPDREEGAVSRRDKS
jgi:hypothetical protein